MYLRDIHFKIVDPLKRDVAITSPFTATDKLLYIAKSIKIMRSLVEILPGLNMKLRRGYGTGQFLYPDSDTDERNYRKNQR